MFGVSPAAALAIGFALLVLIGFARVLFKA